MSWDDDHPLSTGIGFDPFRPNAQAAHVRESVDYYRQLEEQRKDAVVIEIKWRPDLAALAAMDYIDSISGEGTAAETMTLLGLGTGDEAKDVKASPCEGLLDFTEKWVAALDKMPMPYLTTRGSIPGDVSEEGEAGIGRLGFVADDQCYYITRSVFREARRNIKKNPAAMKILGERAAKIKAGLTAEVLLESMGYEYRFKELFVLGDHSEGGVTKEESAQFKHLTSKLPERVLEDLDAVMGSRPVRPVPTDAEIALRWVEQLGPEIHLAVGPEAIDEQLARDFPPDHPEKS